MKLLWVVKEHVLKLKGKVGYTDVEIDKIDMFKVALCFIGLKVKHFFMLRLLFGMIQIGTLVKPCVSTHKQHSPSLVASGSV